jgi:glycosyltransferase involved in cell wall biosynthesis
MKKASPGISVIIACYNSSLVIAETLKCLQVQKNAENINWEVILIDNNSTDNTAEVAKNTWLDPKVPLHILSEKKVGEANARKTGFLHANYSILSIVDDDNRVGSDWIQQIYKHFENPEIGLVGCVGVGDFEEPPPAWFSKYADAFAIGSLYEGDFVDITKDAIVPGAGLAVRKEVFDKLYAADWKPFLKGRVGNIQTAGADSEICYITRFLGYKIYYSNTLRFKHFTAKHRISWERLEKMFAGFGAADVFTLVYRLDFENQNANTLRKKWWVNYAVKKIVTWLKYSFSEGKDGSNKLMKIRNEALCSVIKEHQHEFENGFAYLQDLKLKIRN